MPERKTTADQTIARITDLARQALQAQADLAKQSIELGRASLASEVDAASAGRAWLDAVGRESTRYWTEVGVLGLDVAGQLVSLGTRGMARVMSDTRSAAGRGSARTNSSSGPGSREHHRTSRWAEDDPAHHHAGETTPAQVSDPVDVVIGRRDEDHAKDVAPEDVMRGSVTLHGRAGETATGTVTLANQHPRARRVLLSPSGLRPESGRHVSLELRVDPVGVTIPAMTEQEIRLEAELLDTVVRPGERFVGIIEVSGGVEAVLDVTAIIEA